MKSSLADAFTVVCQSLTTSFLTSTTLIYAIGAGIATAAGTRLALQLILIKRFKFHTLLFIVTTSLCQDWVICAPAAILRFEGRFSGPLSGIKPLFPFTHHHHCRPLSYHQKLTGQIFE
ncbi:hypothetical protein PPACK8108_LOCUS23619 [Phakopsora pachyrhizi]|uniref:Uncharacterized protein n=1 Tax=Phakopsora pachyrhizi TaxID=170000 RepID=A0AAV0BPR8_PHAPC|nr:hypothetical protein PPACK8108_LOCUS23619 [Phakopsora pachyrhizi]